MFSTTLGSELLCSGTYEMDVSSGLPRLFTLESTMDLSVTDVEVPNEFATIGPNSFFMKGYVDQAYVDPMRIEFALTQD
jgi:hypothetical protein